MSEEDQIRRLLADARHDEPMPADVADRMDGVIADLRADRPVRATVTDLAAARRRRRARALLVAAAAVVVAGIGIDQLRGADLGGGSSADSAAGGSAADGQALESEQPQAPTGTDDFVRARAVPVPSARFAQRVRELQGLQRHVPDHAPDTLSGGEAYSSAGGGGRLQDLPKAVGCHAPGKGRVVSVRYDGAPGLLVFRPPTGDTQVVDLILCGHSGIARTITLPAP